MGLQVAMAKKVKNLKVYRDSALVIYQLRGDWLTWDSRMILYHKQAMEMVDNFEVINIEHLPRNENQMADALATLAAMFQINSKDKVQQIRMSIKEEPVHCLHIEEEVDGKPWYYDILQYVRDRRYPYYASENDKRILKTSSHLCGYRLFHKMGRSSIICQCHSIGDLPLHQKRDYMPIWDSKKDHLE